METIDITAAVVKRWARQHKQRIRVLDRRIEALIEIRNALLWTTLIHVCYRLIENGVIA